MPCSQRFGAIKLAARDWRCIAALWLAISALPRSAAASEPDIARYEVSPECPPRDELRRRIHERLPAGFRGVAKLDLRIDLSSSGDYEGTLRLGSEPSRALRGESCEEVIEAVAVIVGVWAVRDAAETAAAMPAKEPTPSPTTFEAQRVPAEEPPVAMTRSEPASPSPTGATGSAPVWGLESGALVWAGPTPRTAWGASIAATVAPIARWSFRLRLERAITGTSAAFPSAVWSKLTLLDAGACWLAFRLPASVDLCGEVAGGRFEAGGVANHVITHPERIERWWLSVGPAARAELPLIASQLGLWLEAGLPIPLYREELVFSTPAADIHETWLVTASIAVGLKALIWGSTPAGAGTAR